jgi:hypothetical protein
MGRKGNSQLTGNVAFTLANRRILLFDLHVSKASRLSSESSPLNSGTDIAVSRQTANRQSTTKIGAHAPGNACLIEARRSARARTDNQNIPAPPENALTTTHPRNVTAKRQRRRGDENPDTRVLDGIDLIIPGRHINAGPIGTQLQVTRKKGAIECAHRQSASDSLQSLHSQPSEAFHIVRVD